MHFIFYLFCTLILIYWWLSFKATDDAFEDEVTESAADIIFGVIDLILLEYILLLAKDFEYVKATYFLIALLAADLVWSLVWKYVGEWETKDPQKVKRMERELTYHIGSSSVMIALFAGLALVSSQLTPVWFVAIFVALNMMEMVASFKTRVISIKIF